VPPDDELPVPNLDKPEEPQGERFRDLLPRMIHQVRRSSGTANQPPPPGKELQARREKLDGARVAYVPTLPDLAPGKYLLTAVVRDATRLKGERFPWVIKDEKGLLEDRHAWVLVVPDGFGK
jgi:hypothetical protein